MHPLDPVTLKGRLVVIEPLRSGHAAELLSAADSDEVFAWLPYPRPVGLDQASAWIAGALADRRADRRLPFAILNALDRRVIGSSSYWDYDRERLSVEIGSTWFSKTCWRTGRNTEAKLLLLTHAFERLDCERVAFRTDILNHQSRQAIERLGAIQEGVHRHELQRRDGSWRDSVHYSILRSEWPQAKQRIHARLVDHGNA